MPAKAKAAGAPDLESAAAAVARLRELIAASDGDAAEAVEAVAEALAGANGTERLAALRAAVSEFDFDRAAAELVADAGLAVSAARRIWNGVLWTMPSTSADQRYSRPARSRVSARTVGAS